MTTGKKRSDPPLPPPKLLVSRQEAKKKLDAQIEKGRSVKKLVIRSGEDLDRAWTELERWSKYNRELLLRLFDNASFADEYTYIGPRISFIGERSLQEGIREFVEEAESKTARLESFCERLELIPEPEVSAIKQSGVGADKGSSRDVFVVHGHDESAKEATARFLEKLGLRAIILHEQPNSGRTIIEKFEDYSGVGFTVVLLTPDDVGSKARETDAEPRARQNVIFELGYFIGKLGRQRVCALYKRSVEIPSDYSGVLYIEMDPAGAWRMHLAREIKQAGIEVDLNKAI